MKKLAVPDWKRCAACGMCRKVCKKEAISIFLGCYAKVDADKCVGCGLCAAGCPAGCITIVDRSVGN